MNRLRDKRNIQIEITNACNLRCVNCSRFVGLHNESFFMELDKIEQALQSLEGFKGTIGCMGGEPTLHPQFAQICELFQKDIPYENRGLWTNGCNWKQYETEIRKTFPINHIVFNDHNFEYKGYHQPLLIASNEIIKNKKLRSELIDKCWIYERWSASISPEGAFFCEVACALDYLFELGGGWRIKKGWWKRQNIQDQVDKYCSLCSAAIPFDEDVYKSNLQYISPKNYENLLLKKNVVLYNKKYTRKDYEKNVKNWNPGTFRDFYQHEPDKRLTKKEEEELQCLKYS